MEIINGIDQDDAGGDCTDIDNATIDSSIIGSTTPAAAEFTNVGIGTSNISGTSLTLPIENDAVTPTLAFGDGVFDGVVLMSVLEHVEHPGEVLEEAHRVLSPEGIFVVLVPNDRVFDLARRMSPSAIPRLHTAAGYPSSLSLFFSAF